MTIQWSSFLNIHQATSAENPPLHLTVHSPLLLLLFPSLLSPPALRGLCLFLLLLISHFTLLFTSVNISSSSHCNCPNGCASPTSLSALSFCVMSQYPGMYTTISSALMLLNSPLTGHSMSALCSQLPVYSRGSWSQSCLSPCPLSQHFLLSGS